MSALCRERVDTALASTESTLTIDSSPWLRCVLENQRVSFVCIFRPMHHSSHSSCTWYIADLQRIYHFISAISIWVSGDRVSSFFFLIFYSLGWYCIRFLQPGTPTLLQPLQPLLINPLRGFLALLFLLTSLPLFWCLVFFLTFLSFLSRISQHELFDHLVFLCWYIFIYQLDTSSLPSLVLHSFVHFDTDLLFLFLLLFDIKYLCESTILYFVLVLFFSSLTLISSLFLESCNDSWVWEDCIDVYWQVRI